MPKLKVYIATNIDGLSMATVATTTMKRAVELITDAAGLRYTVRNFQDDGHIIRDEDRDFLSDDWQALYDRLVETPETVLFRQIASFNKEWTLQRARASQFRTTNS